MSTQLLLSPMELRDIVPAWDVLAKNSIEPNAFYESWALLPALEHFANERVGILAVWQNNSHQKLIALLPLSHESTYKKCPANHWTNWLHIHCPLATPLIHKDYVNEAVAGIFQWLYKDSGATVFSLHKVTTDGDFYAALKNFLKTQKHFLDDYDTWERALLNTDLPAEVYLRSNQRSKKFKEFSRLKRRLSELGKVEFHSQLPGNAAQIDHWMREFLRLEQKGWKGRANTAIACHQNQRLFFEELLRGGAAYKQVMLMKLTLAGEPIAMKLSFKGASGGMFVFKIAYDEEYSQYSPGVLLEVESLYHLLDKEQADLWVDSCTTPNHPLFDHLWAEKRSMANLHISTHHLLSKPLMHTARIAKLAYRYCLGIKA